MRVQFDCNDGGCWISIRNGCRLTAGGGAAIENIRAFANQPGHKLRCFVLNGNMALAKRSSSGDISGTDAPGGSEQDPGCELDFVATKFLFTAATTEPNCGRGNGLVMGANEFCRFHPELAKPSFYHPQRLCGCFGHRFRA